MLDAQVIESFAASLRGTLIQPGDAGYDAARRIYNAMIDKRPRLIAQCADVADVINAVNFGRKHKLVIAVRGGGHNGPGLSLCDDGLVIDLSLMRGIRVDPALHTVRVEPGCRWGDVDHATHAFGLAAVSGVISTTGVGGLTLGGGHGYLTRKYGLTIDNLLGVDMVLADGRFVKASERENADLFWAVRGGGGNFGIVTSFLFRLHPVSMVYAGPTLWPMEQAAEVLRWYRRFSVETDEDLYGFFTFLTVPPVPLFPESLHGRKMCGVVWCYLGPQDLLKQAFQPVHDFSSPLFEHLQPMHYPVMQSMFDGLYPPGLQWYWKGDFVKELSDEAISLHVRHGSELPTALSTMHLYPVDGAVHRVGRNDTAFSYRDCHWSEVIVAVDPDPANNERMIAWARDYWEALHSYSAGGAYVNFMMEEGPGRILATYRDSYDRLVEVKRRYDPDNLFRRNQNISPDGV
ncbi:MAG: FAD-binding oxidoreductase [Desulforhabdus sp.]|nr:FAD-binding oxidoreductase [Desulforhabdus sp.]